MWTLTCELRSGLEAAGGLESCPSFSLRLSPKGVLFVVLGRPPPELGGRASANLARRATGVSTQCFSPGAVGSVWRLLAVAVQGGQESGVQSGM